MQLTNECLAKAMMIASESYSASFFETSHFLHLDKLCDDIPAVVPSPETMPEPALAA